MDAKIGLIIQGCGVIFITTLMYLLTQSLKSNVLKYWKYGWLCLSIALISLQIAFSLKSFTQPFLLLYYLGEYLFGYFLISGCYNFTTNKTFHHQKWYFVGAGFLIAVFLTFFVENFGGIFTVHSFIIGTIFAAAFFTLRRTDSSQKNLGWGLMRFSLAVLALDFYHYTVLLLVQKMSFKFTVPAAYLAFNPIIDLMLEVLLGFGMVIVLMEKIRQETVEVNAKLQEAHEKLEKLVQVDSLTTAFNRHAFHGFLKKKGTEDKTVWGCVGFFDIDNLKPINDELGHFVGDNAIRAVTGAIRSLIRAEDLIFRWGGDEFFVIMISMKEEAARQRMIRLSELLKDIWIEGSKERLTIGVSCGFTNFNDLSDLEKAIKSADEEMYRNKQERKRQINGMTGSFSKPSESPRLSV